jgi:radial spoke head protein 4A
VTKNEDEFDDEEAEDEQEEVDEPQPESGPPLLSSVNEDDGQWFICPFLVRTTNKY